MRPGLLAIEAARIFDAEVSALVGIFSAKGYAWKVLSNDPFWGNTCSPTKEIISISITEFNPTFIHFALHGSSAGLLLKPHGVTNTESMLAWSDIETMTCWENRIVIAGACGVLPYSDAFIKAGAVAAIAPKQDIIWDRLCHFFRIFYVNLFNGYNLSDALSRSIQYGSGYYKKYVTFEVLGNNTWVIPTQQ